MPSNNRPVDPPTRDLAGAALARFGVRPRRLRRLAAHVLRVDAHEGARYALRCTPRSDRSFGDVPLELAWTAALRRDTDIDPPEPVVGLDGVLVQEVSSPDAAEPHDCVLLRWTPVSSWRNA